MNFEQLSKIILTNFERIHSDLKIKQRVVFYLKNYFFLLNLKLKKLKLGLVTFEIKQYFFGNVFLYDIIEMRYSRQDTTEEDELKLENRLNAIKWKWDFQNIGAFFIIAIIIWIIFKNYFDLIMKDLFYSFYDTEKFEVLACHALKITFEFKKFLDGDLFNTFSLFKKSNELFVNTLLRSFIYLKIF